MMRSFSILIYMYIYIYILKSRCIDISKMQLNNVQMVSVTLSICLTVLNMQTYHGKWKIAESVNISNDTQHIYIDIFPYIHIY